jgi:DNA-binding XRE family transcriptional regulator
MRSRHANRKSEECVVVPRREYERLARFAAEACIPPMPEPDERGLFPAIESCRLLTARDLVIRRLSLGFTRAELAAIAGLRASSVERIESGKHATTQHTLTKLEAALERAAHR